MAQGNAYAKSTPEDPRIGPWAADRQWRVHKVIIDVNRQFTGGRRAAGKRLRELLREILSPPHERTLAQGQGLNEVKSRLSHQYLFAVLEGWVIEELVRRDGAGEKPANERALYRIWPDFPIRGLTNRSIATVKADAARNAFAVMGRHRLRDRRR